MVVSVSRRCDIPRFKFDWFLERLDAGFVEVKNPFNSRQTRRVSLLPQSAATVKPGSPPPEAVEAFAFWTRDPAAILEHTEELEGRGYRFYVMTTLTSYPALLEPNAPPAESVIQTMRKLAQKITMDRVIWRYDPIFLSDITDFEFHRLNFSNLAARLNGTVRRIIVSVYDEYPAAEKRLAALEHKGALKRLAHYCDGNGPKGERPLLPAVRELLAGMALAARAEGMEIQSCAEDELAGCSQSEDCPQSGSCGIRPGACIDGELLTKLFGLKAPGRDRSQGRSRCRCVQSADIGTYGHCPAGCVYCYAR